MTITYITQMKMRIMPLLNIHKLPGVTVGHFVCGCHKNNSKI